jgi:hypothetical protein
MGRHNFVFAGADSDGECAAAMYGLIGMARLNGIDPEAWLRHVLTHIADHPVNCDEGFLPWHCAAKLAGEAPLRSGVASIISSPAYQLKTALKRRSRIWWRRHPSGCC